MYESFVRKVRLVIEDETLRLASLKFIQELRAAGMAVDYPLTSAKPDKQFKRAQELKASFTARLEPDETGNITARIRNLSTREEKQLSTANAIREIAAGRQS